MILSQLVVVLRAAAAMTIGVLAVGKLVSLTETAAGAWNPLDLSLPVRRAIIRGLTGVELALAAAILLNPGPRWVLATVVTAFFVVVSAYGLSALARGHACGCGQPRGGRDQKISLAVRNATLWVSACLGVLGPASGTLAQHGDAFAWPIAALPWAGFAALLGWRRWQRIRLAQLARIPVPAH